MTTANSIDGGEFRKALGSFTTGVTVVTTRGTDGSDVGLTANSFNSVSLDPPMVLWSLGRAALSLPHFRAAEHFAVHILATDQQSLSTRFATRGVDKFANLEIERGPDGIPLLHHCATRFVCKTAYQYEGGDHIIFVGEVIGFSHWPRQPLLFHGGQYGQLLSNKSSTTSQDGNELADASLAYLLRYCSHQLLDQLKRELVKHDLTASQYYFLAMLAKFGHGPLEAMLARAAQGDNPPTAAEIDNLVNRGLLHCADGDVHLTQSGSRLHLELVAFYKAAEARALNLLDYDMRQTLQIALTRVAAAFTNEP